MTTRAATIPCDGCGRACGNDPHDGADYATIDIAPGIEGRVCCGGRTSNGAKLSCALKAYQKASACPGCGDKIGDWPINYLCESCGKKIDLAERVQRQESKRRMVLELRDYDVVESPFNEEERQAVAAVLNLVGPITGTERYRVSHGSRTVEVTEEQAEAIGMLTAALKKLYRTARAAGHDEGRSILFGLASGKLSIDELEKVEIEKSRRARGD